MLWTRIKGQVTKLGNNIRNSNYWLTLVVKLMRRIPPIPTENPYRDKLADRIAWCNHKVYDGKYEPAELED